jgi:hypothetical protein
MLRMVVNMVAGKLQKSVIPRLRRNMTSNAGQRELLDAFAIKHSWLKIPPYKEAHSSAGTAALKKLIGDADPTYLQGVEEKSLPKGKRVLTLTPIKALDGHVPVLEGDELTQSSAAKIFSKIALKDSEPVELEITRDVKSCLSKKINEKTTIHILNWGVLDQPVTKHIQEEVARTFSC